MGYLLFRCGFWWQREAGDDDAGGLKVRDAMSVAVAEHDGFAEHHDGAAGFFVEEAADGSVVVDDEIVGGVAFGAVDLLLEGAMEGGVGELADGVVAGADGGYDERHEVKGT